MARLRSLFISTLALSLSVNAASIRVNQLGYYPNGNKFFMVPDAASDSFYVRDVATGTAAFAGKLSASVAWANSGEKVQTGDFSSLKTEGFYYVDVKNVGRSESFRIRKDVYSKAYFDAQRAFYYWRASDSISTANGGIFARPFGHPDTGLSYYPALGKPATATRNVAKGWYDAGDYGKYVVNAGVTMGLLNEFLLMRPTWTGDAVMNIPEANNSVPDLMDEMRWELNWLFSMQDDDGGVFFKITPKNFEGFVLPSKDGSKRLVIGKNTSASLDFAAIMAQSARRWKAYDATLADSMLTVAKKAYAWAVSYPDSQYTQGLGTSYPDVNTGGYGDSFFGDDLLWAKTELWLTTGDASFKPTAAQISPVGQADWGNVSPLAAYSLALEPGASPDAALQSAAQAAVKLTADSIKAQIASDPYRLPTMGFGWGSNGSLASQAMNLLVTFQVTGDSSFIRAADEIAQYFFGKNPLSISYVTGEGNKFTKTPHSRVMGGDGIVAPIPGYVVGGPNSNPPTNDGAYAQLQGCVAAKCYADVLGSFSTNEIAINWQAPLVALLGMVESSMNAHTTLTVDTLPLQVFVDVEGAGSVVATPSKATYSVGDTLHLKATPNGAGIFLGWYGGMLTGASADTFVVLTQDFSVHALFQQPDSNLIKNGAFTDSLNYWKASDVVFASSGVAGLGSIEWTSNQQMRVVPLAVGVKSADVFAFQDGITLGNNHQYTLEFDGSAAAARGISVAILSSTGAANSYSFGIDTAVFHSRYTFTYTGATDPNGRIRFQVGGDMTSLLLDNVSLKMITGTAPPNLGVLGSNSGTAHELVWLSGHSLQINALRGSNMKVDLFSMTGQRIGKWQGISTGVDRVDLNSLVLSHRGISIIRVTTTSGVYSLRWVHAE